MGKMRCACLLMFAHLKELTSAVVYVQHEQAIDAALSRAARSRANKVAVTSCTPLGAWHANNVATQKGLLKHQRLVREKLMLLMVTVLPSTPAHQCVAAVSPPHTAAPCSPWDLGETLATAALFLQPSYCRHAQHPVFPLSRPPGSAGPSSQDL